MSLKAFHIIFIVISTLLALGLGAWEIRSFVAGNGAVHLVLGIVAVLSAVGLAWYGKCVLRKLKHISYL
jgi:DNA-binding transcriptional regulator of glucitol operon